MAVLVEQPPTDLGNSNARFSPSESGFTKKSSIGNGRRGRRTKRKAAWSRREGAALSSGSTDGGGRVETAEGISGESRQLSRFSSRLRQEQSSSLLHHEEQQRDAIVAAALLEPTHVHITRQEDHFIVNSSMKLKACPDSLFRLLTDYRSSPKFVRNFDRVEVEPKEDHMLVTQHASWRFLMMSGSYSIRLRCTEDYSARILRFELDTTGFMKVFSGFWQIDPIASPTPSEKASRLILRQNVQPSFFPPGPLNRLAVSVMGYQVRSCLHDLCYVAVTSPTFVEPDEEGGIQGQMT